MVKILLLMILLHIINDFNLQGILANMKQKSWWLKQEGYEDFYQDDYKIALIIHSLSWAIMITIPLWILPIHELAITIAVVLNAAIHYYFDDLKCNQMKINLYTDQTMHLLQIMLTWIILGFCCA